jgi:hypothetical protein
MINIIVKVKVADLIAALEKNKAQHLLDYEAAKAGYFEKINETLSNALKAAKAEDLAYNYNFSLAVPVLNDKIYDQHIGMFKMAQDEFIEIDSQQYTSFVEDQWHWAVNAKLINSTYSGGR